MLNIVQFTEIFLLTQARIGFAVELSLSESETEMMRLYFFPFRGRFIFLTDSSLSLPPVPLTDSSLSVVSERL